MESVPAPFRLTEVVCLSFCPHEGEVYLVVTHVFHHQSGSKYRDLQTPAHCRFVIVLAGVILTFNSTIGINGYSMFSTNSAKGSGGETGLGTCIALNILRTTTKAVPLIASGGTLFYS